MLTTVMMVPAGSALPRTAITTTTCILNQGRAFSRSCLQHTARRRSTLSEIWVPTGGRSITADESTAGHEKLIRAGFLRQSQSGIFHLLPLGTRVQDKIKSLLDKHMQGLGASRLSLSSITTEELWQKSGRFDRVSSELFRFNDRRHTPLMLSPTHEEEITSLVASNIKSYKDLPLRLYQITRKYRDEKRPRHGLLRSREFIMKDLYTFDLNVESAIDTYQDVSRAYRAFFSDLKLPILVAEASSGDMGGSHSHEYHLANATGEDIVATCRSCGYTANDEVAAARPLTKADEEDARLLKLSDFCVWRGITKDRKTLVNAWYPSRDAASGEDSVNLHVVKSVVPNLDASVNDPVPLWKESLRESLLDDSENTELDKIRLLNVVDSRLASAFQGLSELLPLSPDGSAISPRQQWTFMGATPGEGLNLLRLTHGDPCPRCDGGTLEIHKALELGHTFLLGTRYSEPLGLSVALPQKPGHPVPVQMGCFGIGISRILGTVAEHLADDRGLNWPRAIAPFEAVIIPTSSVNEQMLAFYDGLSGFDVVLDDRKESFGWKIQDADTTGYPVAIILGKAWREEGVCEVQCRRLGMKERVAANDVARYLSNLLEQL